MIKRGLILVNAMHITASVFINDNERGIRRDGGFRAPAILGSRRVPLRLHDQGQPRPM